MSPEAFRHLPQLREKIVPPEQSPLRATPEVMASWDAMARARGMGPQWRYSDAALEEARRTFLAQTGSDADLWVFGYGSLMWDPAIRFEEIRLAAVDGYRRRFSFRTEIGRGSPEHPALMLSLEAGCGQCVGLAFRIHPTRADEESSLLWRREMIRGSYVPAYVPATTPQGAIRVVLFGPNVANAGYVGELPLDETARIIANGSGFLGSNRGYLEELVGRLDDLNIEEDYIRALLKKVVELAPS